MATTKKKTTSKKSAAKKTAPKKTTAKKTAAPKKTVKKDDGPSRAEKREALLAQVMDLVDGDGLSFDEAAKQLKVNRSTVIDLHVIGSVKPKDRIKGSEEEVAAEIVRQRDEENVAWHVIAARAGVTKTRARAIYEETSGSDSRQGMAVMTRRAEAKAATAPSSKGAKSGTKTAAAKAKKSAKTKSRKAAKGTANPSKG